MYIYLLCCLYKESEDSCSTCFGREKPKVADIDRKTKKQEGHMQRERTRLLVNRQVCYRFAVQPCPFRLCPGLGPVLSASFTLEQVWSIFFYFYFAKLRARSC